MQIVESEEKWTREGCQPYSPLCYQTIPWPLKENSDVLWCLWKTTKFMYIFSKVSIPCWCNIVDNQTSCWNTLTWICLSFINIVKLQKTHLTYSIFTFTESETDMCFTIRIYFTFSLISSKEVVYFQCFDFPHATALYSIVELIVPATNIHTNGPFLKKKDMLCKVFEPEKLGDRNY